MKRHPDNKTFLPNLSIVKTMTKYAPNSTNPFNVLFKKSVPKENDSSINH